MIVLLSVAGRLVIKAAIMMGAAIVTMADPAKTALPKAGKAPSKRPARCGRGKYWSSITSGIVDTWTMSETMKINKNDTALVVIDPQNDVLSEHAVDRDAVGGGPDPRNSLNGIGQRLAGAEDAAVETHVNPVAVQYLNAALADGPAQAEQEADTARAQIASTQAIAARALTAQSTRARAAKTRHRP